MGIMDFVKGGMREMMIARPPQASHRFVYKHPDRNLPGYSQIAVEGDECALFFKDGHYHGKLAAGRYTLQAENMPFLSDLIAGYTGGDIFIADIFFVRIQPILGVYMGGPLALMRDPILQEFVTPRILCNLALQVTDPVRFVIGYQSQPAMDEELTLDWIRSKLLMTVKTVIGRLIATEQKSFLDLCGMTPDISSAILQEAPNLEDVGIRIADIGNFDISFNAEDLQLLLDASKKQSAARHEM